MRPQRIQLRRTKGWRKPDNTIVVARPSKWGNPYRLSEYEVDYSDEYGFDESQRRGFATSDFRGLVEGRWDGLGDVRSYPRHEISQLRGKNLACWCPLDQPCHADVLLELANS